MHSNLARFGADLEANVLNAGGKQAEEWKTAGKKVGLEVWRVESFKASPWDRPGVFHSEGAFIVLETGAGESKALSHRVYVWLGQRVTQDDAGAAAYKVVELDEALEGVDLQGRVVEGREPGAFARLFPAGLTVLESSEAEKRLLLVKGRLHIRVTQVPFSPSSVNASDAFVLDEGARLLQYVGAKAAPRERVKASQYVAALLEERGETTKFVEGEDAFWASMGGKPEALAENSPFPTDEEWELAGAKERLLFEVAAKHEVRAVAAGTKITRDMFDPSHAYIYDVGNEVYVWVGAEAPVEHRKLALVFGQTYLLEQKRAATTPVSRVAQGGETQAFEASFRLSSASVNADSWQQHLEASGKPKFDGHASAQRVYDALQASVFKDKSVLIEELGARPWHEIGAICVAFEREVHPEDRGLNEVLSEQLSFSFGRLISALTTPPAVYRAQVLHEALTRTMPDLKSIMNVLAHLGNEEREVMRASFAKEYPESKLEDLVKAKFGKSVQVGLLHLLNGRSGSGDALEHAKALYKAGEKRLGTNETVFLEVLCLSTEQHVQSIRELYAGVSKKGRSLDEAVHSEMGGKLKTLVMACVRTRAEYYARELQKALTGVGTSRAYLQQIVVLNSPQELRAIDVEYMKMAGAPFCEHLKGEAIAKAGKLVPLIEARFGAAAK